MNTFIRYLVIGVLSLIVLGNENIYAQADSKPKKLNIAMAGLAAGGAYASIGEGVLECIRKSYPGSTASYEAGQEGANIVLVSGGKLQIGIANSQLVQMAYAGVGPFKQRKMENLRSLALLYEDVYFHFLIKKSTGIQTVEDIKNKKYPLKINFNTKGSFMQIAGEQVLNAYGITESDIKSWGGRIGYLTAAQTIDQMRDNITEAFITMVQSPFSAFVDASLTMDLVLLPVNNQAAKIVNESIFTSSSFIPKNAYSFVLDEIPTVKSSVIIFGSSHLSDEEAYSVVKAISDNIDYMKGIHSSVKKLDSKNFPVKSDKIPMHSGAAKFYREVGILK